MLWTWIVVLALLLIIALTVIVVYRVNSHRQFTRLPDLFQCRVRTVRGRLPGIGERWQPRPVWASWAHDVLLVRLGRWPATTHVLAVRCADGSVETVPDGELRGLGPEPVMVRLRLDDDAVVEVATSGAARDLVVGPFLAACLTQNSEETDDRPPGR